MKEIPFLFAQIQGLVRFDARFPWTPYYEPDKLSHNLTPYFTKIQFNIILPSISGLANGLFPSGYLVIFLYIFLLSLVTESSGNYKTIMH
jgi:hypothetical protein